jgi:site-specific recombinase XerC
MDSYLDQFLAYLRLSRNVSELTCKAYGEDIAQIIEFA